MMILQSSGNYGEWFGLGHKCRARINRVMPNQKFDPVEKE